DRGQHFARGQLEHRTLEVQLEDILLVLRARLQRRIDRVEAILRQRLIAMEERVVEAARAGDIRGTEVRADTFTVTRDLRSAAIVPCLDAVDQRRRGEQRPVTSEGQVTAAGVVPARPAVRVVTLARPVRADIEVEDDADLDDGSSAGRA